MTTTDNHDLNPALPKEAALTDDEKLTELKRWYWSRLYRLMIPDRASSPAVNQLLIILGAVFILTTFPTFKAPSELALEWGILYGPWVMQGELWRIVTGQLMHANWLHIGSNCFGLWIFGRQIEPILGAKGMWWLYGICAIFTAIFTLWLVPNASIGASGISYGVLGCNVMLVFLIRRQQNRKKSIKDAIGLLLLSAAYIGMNLTTANLNIWGHAGGFLGGLVFASWQFSQLQTGLNKLIVQAQD